LSPLAGGLVKLASADSTSHFLLVLVEEGNQASEQDEQYDSHAPEIARERVRLLHKDFGCTVGERAADLRGRLAGS